VGTVLNLGRDRDPDQDPPRLPTIPPADTPWNTTVGRYRRFARRSVPLDEVKATGKAAGATVNDVVVAVCAGALRRYLVERDALPVEPLTAMIPVSLRTGEEPDMWTNRVSATIAALPTDLDDPEQRLAAAHDALNTAKAVFKASPAALAPDGVDLSAPAVTTLVSRVTSRWVTARIHPFNVVVSNVPGPQEPLYMAGARAQHYYPVSAIADGVGLNITVQSYDGSMDLGLVADADLVPDLPVLADAFVAEHRLLHDRVGG
jgi:WS/DGAT/MGAT family acyltransferase